MVTEHHVKTIFIDYIDLVIPENSKVSLNEQRGDIAKALKILSRELSIPIIVVCSISRGANGAQNPFAHVVVCVKHSSAPDEFQLLEFFSVLQSVPEYHQSERRDVF